MKTAAKTWFAKDAAISIHRTRLTCNKACNIDKTTWFTLICDLGFRDFVMLTATLN